jgi:hypothetical protein
VGKGRALMTGLVGPGGPLWEKSDPRFFAEILAFLTLNPVAENLPNCPVGSPGDLATDLR